MNVDRPTNIWLQIGTLFATLTRNNQRSKYIIWSKIYNFWPKSSSDVKKYENPDFSWLTPIFLTYPDFYQNCCVLTSGPPNPDFSWPYEPCHCPSPWPDFSTNKYFWTLYKNFVIARQSTGGIKQSEQLQILLRTDHSPSCQPGFYSP